jgi:hypothetical protein
MAVAGQFPQTKLGEVLWSPANKKGQLSLAGRIGDLPDCEEKNRPDPVDPGGLGAEESGAKRTGSTQYLSFAAHNGGGWAEFGQQYDFS